MEVARTSMIHAAAPHFLWPFAVRYAAYQLNLWPRVSLPETLHTLRWTGKVGNASVFRVWGSRAFVCDTSVDKLSSRAIPCVFLGFPPDAPGWQFYHPTSRRVLPSQDVTFDESPSGGPPPPSGSCSFSLGVLSLRVRSLGLLSLGVRSLGPLSPQQLREWFAKRTRLRSGAAGVGGSAAEGTRAGGAGATSLGGDGVTAGAGGTRGTGAAGPGGARTRGTRAAGAGGVRDSGAGDPGARGNGAEGAGDGGGGAGDSDAGGAGARGAGAGDRGAEGTGAGGAKAGGAGAGNPSAGGAGAEGTGDGDPGAGGAGGGGAGASGPGSGGTVQRRPFFVPPEPSSLPPPGSLIC
ncbi:unnamed protein product [Closterium sp. NIES-53]